MVQKQTIAKAAVVVAFAAVYTLIDWIGMLPLGFPDLDNYRYGFQSGWYLFTILNLTPVEFLLAEGVWVHLFDAVYSLVGDIETAFLVISFVSIVLMGLYVVWRTRNSLYLAFFINPAYIDLAIGQIRSGLAAGIFWLAIYIKNVPIKIALLVLAASIHTAFFVFGTFYGGFLLFQRTGFGQRILARQLPATLMLIFLGLAVTLLRNGILAAVGDVRGFLFLEYTSGVFLALAWMTFAFTYVAWRSKPALGFEPSFYAFCSSMALFSALIGVYGSRFSSVAIPALAAMCADLPPRYRLLLFLQYAIFSIIYFVYYFAAQGRAF